MDQQQPEPDNPYAATQWRADAAGPSVFSKIRALVWGSRLSKIWLAGVSAPAVAMTLGLLLDIIFPWQWVKPLFVLLMLSGLVGMLVALWAVFLTQASTRVKLLAWLGTIVLAGAMWFLPFVVALGCYVVYIIFFG